MFQKFLGFKLAHKVPISKSAAKVQQKMHICKQKRRKYLHNCKKSSNFAA